MYRDRPTGSGPVHEDDAGGFLTADDWATVSTILALSPRECQIAKAVLSGRSERQVAELLHISRHTVHTHIERLYRKLAVNNRVQLVLRVFETYVRIRTGPDSM